MKVFMGKYCLISALKVHHFAKKSVCGKDRAKTGRQENTDDLQGWGL